MKQERWSGSSSKSEVRTYLTRKPPASFPRGRLRADEINPVLVRHYALWTMPASALGLGVEELLDETELVVPTKGASNTAERCEPAMAVTTRVAR